MNRSSSLDLKSPPDRVCVLFEVALLTLARQVTMRLSTAAAFHRKAGFTFLIGPPIRANRRSPLQEVRDSESDHSLRFFAFWP